MTVDVNNQMTRGFDLIRLIPILLVVLLTSCTYLKYSAIQAQYTHIQNADPSQVNLKHMLTRDTFFVVGKSIDKSSRYNDLSMAVAAYSNKFKQNERVDTMFFKNIGTHYGLTLPAGHYTLLVYADINKDQVFDQTEIVGQRAISLNLQKWPEKIMKPADIELKDMTTIAWAETIPRPEAIEATHSLFYPAGTIRSLDDPIFDEKIATMGMYDPASFLEHAQTMFYALEEDLVHKIPVVFVHGIGGSSRSFEPIINQIDRDRYRLWFFYYPSGGDLDQLADFFYSLFLSSDVIPLGEMPMIVVAHSMGGLVVRQALNKYQGKANENKVELFVTIASPLGGHPAAAAGEAHGLIVLPSWKDLNPQSRFIIKLYTKPLPTFVNHQLFYAYKNASSIKLGENSDGVVPLTSQLHPAAQQQSREQFGFNSGHVDILENQQMITQLLNKMQKINGIFPQSHMKLLVDGGFDVKLDEQYSAMTQHLIGYAGKYLVSLIKGIIEPVHPQQQHFIRAVRKEIPATSDLEREFILFISQYPQLIDDVN